MADSYEDLRVADPEYLAEYAQLKEGLLKSTRQSGGALAAYLIVTVDGESALCCLLGMAFANAYLLWLFADVDAVKGTDMVAMVQAKKIQQPLLRYPAMLVAAYSHALKPRLLVLVALAALFGLYNKVADEPARLVDFGGALLGFLSYKGALLLKVFEENKPKNYAAQEVTRPMIDRVEDELDQWGRPKKQFAPLPTEALPEGTDVSNPPPLARAIINLTHDEDGPEILPPEVLPGGQRPLQDSSSGSTSSVKQP